MGGGNPQHKNDHRRSIPLANLAPLLEIDTIAFYSLQYGQPGGDIAALGWQNRLIDCAPQLTSWKNTAQVLTQLDVLITVDTAIAHLSGALGKPTWMLLPFMPDFRWLLAKEESPWYASLRLFCQPQRGDWDAVIKKVAFALQVLTV